MVKKEDMTTAIKSLSHVIFIYGDDTYRSHQALKAIKAKYIDTNLGDLNLVELEGDTLTIDELNRQVRALPFLANKRLVIVKSLLGSKNKDLSDKLLEFLPSVPQSSLLIIYEVTVDKRTSVFKNLAKAANTKSFPQLDDHELKKWVKNQVTQKGGTITPDGLDQLTLWVGSNLWQMTQEIDKLLAHNPTITKDHILLLTPPKTETIIFKLTDELFSGSSKSALKILDELRQQGEADLAIFNLIISSYRNLILISLAQAEGMSQSNLAAQLKIHPFVVSKSLNIIRKTDLPRLKQKYTLLLDIDFKLKTGKIDPVSGLDLALLQLMDSN
jgi:DNA polymerase-3 subunit delta